MFEAPEPVMFGGSQPLLPLFDDDRFRAVNAGLRKVRRNSQMHTGNDLESRSQR